MPGYFAGKGNIKWPSDAPRRITSVHRCSRVSVASETNKKKGTKSLNRNSKLVFVTLVAFISLFALGTSFVGRAHATGVLTLNCPNPECDYGSGSTVTITGSSFANGPIDLVVTRPDGSTDQCVNGVYSGSQTIGGQNRLATCPLSASGGSFIENYALDGIYGAYTVSASDGSIAYAYFHDSLSTDWTQCENDNNHNGILDSPLFNWTTGNFDCQPGILA